MEFHTVKVTGFFLRVLIFDIFVDWPKTQNFVPANSINYTIEH